MTTLPINLMRLQSNLPLPTSMLDIARRRPWKALGVTLVRTAWCCALLCLLSCEASKENASDPEVNTTPVSDKLPPLTLRDETPDLLLTWIDEQGDFHVVLKPSEVPEGSREKVRAVVTTNEEGTGKLVYIADLRSKNADGAYQVSTATRAQWDALGADRREVRLEALAPKAPDPSASASAQPAGGKVSAIVYGADWCNPCHQAEKLLKGLGVDVTKKDIEKSPAAKAEMQQRLAKAGRVGASIPVIDVAGQIFVGYSPRALKQAVNRARKPETL